MNKERTTRLDGASVVLRGPENRERLNGALVLDDDRIHLGIIDPITGSLTACGHRIRAFMATYSDVEITCPACATRVLGDV